MTSKRRSPLEESLLAGLADEAEHPDAQDEAFNARAAALEDDDMLISAQDGPERADDAKKE